MDPGTCTVQLSPRYLSTSYTEKTTSGPVEVGTGFYWNHPLPKVHKSAINVNVIANSFGPVL